jgi:tyrosyl-tRNA synthetase
MTPTTDFLAELSWRGMLHQHTEGAPAALAAGPVSAYCGFDPTAASLHVGSLLPVMGLVQLQRAGHRPVALVGGGTGMIGDPSGKTSERQLASREVVEENTRALRAQLGRFLDFSGGSGARMVDNAEWLRPFTAIDFLRDVGKHFSVNVMLAKESVRQRMETGISFTEFAYQLLQAYDFVELNRRYGVTAQVGGSDQWGNIVAGTDLMRRMDGREAHGVTFPLLATASGAKFGKSEGNAVWLDAARTSPYKFYQFWMHADDNDVGRFLRFFTLMPREEIEALDAATADRPEKREAQQALAADVTERVHGVEAGRAAEEVSALLFGRGEPTTLSPAALDALAAEVPYREIALPDEGGQIDGLDLMVSAGLAASRGAAKRLVEQGGAYANGRRLTMAERTVDAGSLLAGEYVLLRKGARDYGLVRVR